MKFLSFLFLCILSVAATAALPTQLPLTRADAYIYSLTHMDRVERSAWASPMGQVKLFDLEGKSLETYKRTQISAPANGTKLMDIVNSDRFRVVLPTERQQFEIAYMCLDKYGNCLLSAQNAGSISTTADDRRKKLLHHSNMVDVLVRIQRRTNIRLWDR